jgi:hypothetical protein
MTLLATRITDALTTQLATAKTAAGYVSNIGASVFVGQLRGGAVQSPCTYIVPMRTVDQAAYSNVLELTRSIDVRGFADANDHPTLTDAALVDLIAWDIRRCLAAAGTGLTSLVRDLRVKEDSPGYREEGGTLVGASVSIEVDYAVALSDPSTPV